MIVTELDVTIAAIALYGLILLAYALPGRVRQATRPRYWVAEQQVQAAPVTPAVVVDPADAETRRWVAQGMHKLGYTMPEAKRLAEQVPAGMDLQSGLQWCLKHKGAKP